MHYCLLYLIPFLVGFAQFTARAAEPSVPRLMVFPVYKESEIIHDPNAGPQYPAYNVKEYRITIYVYLYNQGDNVLRIPTAAPKRGGASYRLGDDGKRTFRIICSQHLQTAGGTFPQTTSFSLIPSESSLSIVELNSRELTMFTVFADVPAEVNPLDIEFVFSVDDAIGKRFNTWSGKIAGCIQKETSSLQQMLAERTRSEPTR